MGNVSPASVKPDEVVLPDLLDFGDVLEAVESFHDRNLGDEVTNLSEMMIEADLTVNVKGIGWARMTRHAKGQLGALVGVQFDKWFGGIEASQIQHELGLRFPKLGKKAHRLVRARKLDEGDNLIRAFLSPGYEVIDDIRVFQRLNDTRLNDWMAQFHFLAGRIGLSYDETKTSFYTLAFGDLFAVGDKHFWPTVQIGNSEVGSRSLTIDLTFVCLDGLWGFMRPTPRPLLYRQHRKISDDTLDEQIEEAFINASSAATEFAHTLTASHEEQVSEPTKEIERFLSRKRIPKRDIENVVQSFEANPTPTRFGIGSLIAEEGGRFEDPDKRDGMEQAATLFILETTF